jgi:hypothetical protein
MNYYLELADESGAFARWRIAAVLFAANRIGVDDLPMEAALLLAAEPTAGVVALASRYKDDDSFETRQIFESALIETGLAVPSRQDALTFALALDARSIDLGEARISDFSWEYDELQYSDLPSRVMDDLYVLGDYWFGFWGQYRQNQLEAIASLASFLDGRSIPEWLALLTDPSRDSPAFADPVPEAKPGRRGRARSLAARAIRRIRGGRSA